MRLIWQCLFSGSLMLTVSALHEGSAFAQPPSVKVVVGRAEMVNAPDTVRLVGTVFPNRISRVASRVEGMVVNMPAREGDRIEQGGVICRLNEEVLSWQLAEARAALASFRARHQELIAGTRKEDLDALRAAYDEAAANHERWKFEMERVERLFEGSESNPKELRDTRAEYAIAVQRMAAARAAYDKGVAGERPEVIARAEYDVAEQEAIVKRLERDLEKKTVQAPFTGYVTQRHVEIGEWVATGVPIVEMVELDRVLVRVDAPESAFPFLTVGDNARVSIDALGRSFEGTVKHVIPKADRSARTVPVEIEVDNKHKVLAAGMFARAIVRSGPRRELVAVPRDAVLEREGTVYIATVFEVNASESKKLHCPNCQHEWPESESKVLIPGLKGVLMPVTIGASVDDWIAITSGNVRPGMPVIVRGNERMMPFPMAIQVVDELGRPIDFTLDEVPLEARSH